MPGKTSGQQTMDKQPGMFATTRWTLLERARQPEDIKALDELCRRYWQPVNAFLRRSGCTPADAEDLTQEFFRDFMARGGFAAARRERGRFRSFLLGCVGHHHANARKAAGRLKRGGGVEFTAIDDGPGDGLSPDEAFDKRWAEALVDRALERLRTEWESQGRPFEVLAPYLSGERGAVPLEETAARLGVSLAATKSAVHRLRQRLGELVKEEVGATVDDARDAADELDYLLRMLSR